MKKYIKIEWDDTTMNVIHSCGLATYELIGILEAVKSQLWERRTLKEKNNYEND